MVELNLTRHFSKFNCVIVQTQKFKPHPINYILMVFLMYLCLCNFVLIKSVIGWIDRFGRIGLTWLHPRHMHEELDLYVGGLHE
jgi:hypothetical protein